MHHTSKIPIANLNQHLICSLCGGYFIDATTIIECLHSFCKSCIVRYLETNKFCPVCDVQIHKTKPLLHIRSDQTLQAVVYKLVPGLFQREMQLRRDFYKKHPDKLPEDPQDRGEGTNTFIYSSDEIICLSLEYADKLVKQEEDMETDDDGIPRRYLRCPAAVTVGLLKRLVRGKYGLDPSHALDILYGDSFLCDEYSLVDLAYMFDWKRNGPMRLKYRIYQDIDMPPSPSVNDEKAQSTECKKENIVESSDAKTNGETSEATQVLEKKESLTENVKLENGDEDSGKPDGPKEIVNITNGSVEETPASKTKNSEVTVNVEKEPSSQPTTNGLRSEDKVELANDSMKQDAEKVVYKTLKLPQKVWNPKVPTKRTANDSDSDATPAKKASKTPRLLKARSNEDDKGASVASVTESPVQEVAVNLTKPSSPKKSIDKKERHTPSPRTRTESSSPNPSQSKISTDDATANKQKATHSILPFVPEDAAQQFRFPHPAWLNLARGARPQMLLGNTPFANRSPLPPSHFLTSLIASQQPFPYLSSLLPNEGKKGTSSSSKMTGPRALAGFPAPFNAMQGFPPGLSALLPLPREMMGSFYHPAYNQPRSFTPPPNRCASPKSSPSGAITSQTPTTSTSSGSSSKPPKSSPRPLAPRRVSAPPPLVPISSTPGPPIRSPPTLLPLKEVDKERVTPPASSSPAVTVVESSIGESESNKEPAQAEVKEKAEEKASTENSSNVNDEKTSQDQSVAPSKTPGEAAADS